jgi:hypothetical protein
MVLFDRSFASADRGAGLFLLRLIRGQGVLDATGQFQESLPGLPVGTTAHANADVPFVAGAGSAIRAGYDPTTGLLTVKAFGGAAAAGMHVNYLVLA